jgi:uncharacterized protein (TIGR02186 family)
MRRRLLALLLAFWAAPAGGETLVTSLSSHQVQITSNYTGAQVVLFGAVERDAQSVARSGDYDVVVTVRGPRQTVTVREKEPLGPIWINREQQKFAEVPAFLGVFSSQPVAAVTTEALRRRFRIGIDAVVGTPDAAAERGEGDDPFREALVRLKTRERLFVEEPRGVAFLTPTLFRTAIDVPATAPPGPYEVEVALFWGSVLLARTQTHFELLKTGFEEQVGELARDWSALYGGVTGMFALLFGWIASVIFRRD